MSKLTDIYRDLRAAAAATGTAQQRQLRHGARLTVQVCDGQETVTFARPTVPLGETEEQTFRQHCRVPTGAERLPKDGQQPVQEGTRTWHQVTYRWPVAAQPRLPGMDETEETEEQHG
jgi:hypothetical protein